MKKILAIFSIIAGAASYYFFYYPPTVMKRATQNALESFADAVATKDRVQIKTALKTLLSTDAKINLKVTFFAFINKKRPALIQDFDKEEFISFIDNIIYPLTDYGYYNQLDEFILSEDKKTADIVFSSNEWGDGNSYYGGISVMSRFSSQTSCKGVVSFTGAQPQLKHAECDISFRNVPKPGEANKLRNNIGSLKDLLLKN